MRLLGVLLCLATPMSAQEPILIQSTTSTQNSGLFEEILPQFETDTGWQAHVVAVGTGQALKNAQNCDGDILITHARDAEERFVAAGFGVARHDLMYNDFVLVGPEDDPLGIAGAGSIEATMALLAEGAAPFLSRGDDSGTHSAERRLWALAGLSEAEVTSRLETGQGMGATLNMSVAMGAYTLTDRATWLAFQNRRTHRIVFEGDEALFNAYGVIVVSPEHCPRANSDGAAALQDWLLSEAGRTAITGATVAGEQLFFVSEPAQVAD